ATGLETTIKDLRDELRSPQPHSRTLSCSRFAQRSASISPCLASWFLRSSSSVLELVSQIGAGMEEYLQKWRERGKVAPDRLATYDRMLAELLDKKVLVACNDLHRYNARQIEASDEENQSIIHALNWGLLAVGIGAPLGGLLLGYAVARQLRHS